MRLEFSHEESTISLHEFILIGNATHTPFFSEGRGIPNAHRLEILEACIVQVQLSEILRDVFDKL